MASDGVRPVTSCSEFGGDADRGRIFIPAKLGGMELRNRVVRAGCFEGMCQSGGVIDALIEHRRTLAAGGVAMTT